MTYGDLEIDALPEGRFTVGLDKRFVPYAEGDPPRPGTLFVSVTPFLVRAPDETLLVDTGLGSWAEGRGTEVLLDSLVRRGVAPEDVDRVVLSHLHFDHTGGAVTRAGAEGWRPTFPAADYVVQHAEATAEGYAGESARARDLVLDTLDRAGQLVYVEGDADLGRVGIEVTGGHTGAHQLVRLHAGDMQAVFGGDVLGTPGQVGRRFQAKYDVDGAASQAWRDRLAAEAAEAGHLLLFYHSPEAPAAFVSDGPKGQRVVEPVDL
ncbi:MBL fold metallo-hydrolase [Rubrivirga sp. S365]|uniref:MBL fold metallo-hydrolase n=1 Tax=Rubrivirga sp. S365 TaxID=3076080 RepID=UPI0028C9B2AD|nr:MBL fold metallo-hydrolase [Rubrivirga sp. S365]MDT7856435.1 MBL fold metallo-hydrolase [Rubrivirga sp. S365]